MTKITPFRYFGKILKTQPPAGDPTMELDLRIYEKNRKILRNHLSNLRPDMVLLPKQPKDWL